MAHIHLQTERKRASINPNTNPDAEANAKEACENMMLLLCTVVQVFEVLQMESVRKKGWVAGGYVDGCHRNGIVQTSSMRRALSGCE